MNRKKDRIQYKRKQNTGSSFNLWVNREGEDILMEEGKYFLGTLSMVCYLILVLQQCFCWDLPWWLLLLMCGAVTAVFIFMGAVGEILKGIRVPVFAVMAVVMWVLSDWKGMLYHLSQITASQGIGIYQLSGAEYGEIQAVLGLIALILCVVMIADITAEHCPVVAVIVCFAATIFAVFLGWVPDERLLFLVVSVFCLLSPSLAGGFVAVLAVMVSLVVGSLFIEPGVEKKPSAVQTALERWRFGENSVSREEGSISGTFDQDGDDPAFLVTMKEPSVCYLRGYTGMVYGHNSWNNDRDVLKKLEMGLNSGEQDLFGFLRLRGFSSRVLLGQSVRLGAEKKWEQQSINIENVGADRRYLYLPYELAETEMSLAAETPLLYGMGENIYGSGLRGAAEYAFRSYPCLAGEKGEKIEDSRLSQYEQYIRQTCLTLPKETRDIIAEAFGRQGISSVATEREKAAWIRNWLASNIPYTDQPEEIAEGTDFARWFFKEKNKSGEIQFAAAAVMMFRYMGIPARYAEGYIISPSDVENAKEGEIIVPQKNIHAWPEIYIEEKGWIPVEVIAEYEEFMQVSYLYEEDSWKVENDSTDTDTQEQDEEESKVEEESDAQEEGTQTEENQKESSSSKRFMSGKKKWSSTGGPGWTSLVTAVVFLLGILFLLAIFLRYEWNRRTRKKWRTSQNHGWHVRESYLELEEALRRAWSFLKKEEWKQDNRTVMLAVRLRQIDGQLDEEQLQECLRIRQKAVYGRRQITEEERKKAAGFFEKETEYVLGLLPVYRRWKFFLRRM